MTTGHAHALYRHGDSRLHRLAPECKVAAVLAFVVAVVATPREAFWAFGVHALLVVASAGIGRIPPRFLLTRLVIEAPFVLFALLLPFVGGGDRVEVAGVAVSREGLWAAWNILAKATLGLAGTMIVAATTPVADLLRGLDRLHVPRPLTAIAGFMVRYLDVIAGEFQRTRIALASRGYDPRWLWQARAVASTAGTLFVRSYERGERVYLAMLSRGYDGALPRSDEPTAPAAQWAVVLAVPAFAALTSAAAWAVR